MYLGTVRTEEQASQGQEGSEGGVHRKRWAEVGREAGDWPSVIVA